MFSQGLLERPDAGEVFLNSRACGRLTDDDRTAIRRNEIGFTNVIAVIMNFEEWKKMGNPLL